jgi:hypothetical protein
VLPQRTWRKAVPTRPSKSIEVAGASTANSSADCRSPRQRRTRSSPESGAPATIRSKPAAAASTPPRSCKSQFDLAPLRRQDLRHRAPSSARGRRPGCERRKGSQWVRCAADCQRL